MPKAFPEMGGLFLCPMYLTQVVSLWDLIECLDSQDQQNRELWPYDYQEEFQRPEQSYCGKPLVEEALHLPSEWDRIKRGKSID